LIDVLALEGRLRTIDAYEISARRFPKMRYRGVIAKEPLIYKITIIRANFIIMNAST
jgi:hypothetical protein